MGGTGLSKSHASRLCKEIDEHVDAFLTRPIESEWLYLWIDATDLKVRQAGRIVSISVTIAVGVNKDGRREVLGMAIGPSEAETFWTDLPHAPWPIAACAACSWWSAMAMKASRPRSHGS
jgi:transposase-like protein